MSNIEFKKRKSIEQVEESNELAPKFDSNGIITVVTTDFAIRGPVQANGSLADLRWSTCDAPDLPTGEVLHDTLNRSMHLSGKLLLKT